MFGYKSRFKTRAIGSINQYMSFTDILKSVLNLKGLFKILVVFLAVGVIFYVSGYFFSFGKTVLKGISKATLSIASNNIGQELEKDHLGQVNVLIIGFGGENHAGGYLSDTMMIASFNPELGVVTFLSVPRDLEVKYANGGYGRINAIFSDEYRKTKSKDSAALALGKKLEEITGVGIQYYALVDFGGFTKLVDKIGGVDVDVPYDLVDREYPTLDHGYTTFQVSKGMQHFDGSTALKYARSRHSTSDFSRALRQQQIIKGIVDKVLSAGTMLDVSKMKDLYSSYKDIVYTNISFKQMLGMAKYLDQKNSFYSYVITADCTPGHHSTMQPGCFLYYPPRDWFGGASVLLPQGATSTNLGSYKNIQNFAFMVVYNQKFLLENASVKIMNGADWKLVKKKYRTAKSLANDLATEMKRYGFNITSTENVPKDMIYPKTLLYKNGTGDYSTTINLMKMFVDFDEVKEGDPKYGDGITLIIGNDYLDK